MFRLFRRRLQDEQGQSLVELAVVLPVLLLILFGIIEFGRVFGAYLTLTSASREAARAGVVGATNAQMETLVGSKAGLDWNNLTITITPPPSSRKRGEELTVRLDYEVQIFTPIIGDLVGNSVSLTAETTMRIE